MPSAQLLQSAQAGHGRKRIDSKVLRRELAISVGWVTTVARKEVFATMLRFLLIARVIPVMAASVVLPLFGNHGLEGQGCVESGSIR